MFTIGNNVERFKDLKDSAELCGLFINYLIIPSWTGYDNKITYLRDAIKNLPENDIICFIDAYDVIVYGDENDILDKFYSFKSNFVIGCEANCFPGFAEASFPKFHPKTIFRYLNSGNFIGYKSAVFDYVTWKSDEEIKEICKKGSDQYYLMCYFTEFYKTKGIVLDHDQIMFQLMFGVSWYDFKIKEGRIYNSVLKTYPNVLHFNGNSQLTNKKLDIRSVFNSLIEKGDDGSGLLEFKPKFNKWGVWRPQLQS